MPSANCLFHDPFCWSTYFWYVHAICICNVSRGLCSRFASYLIILDGIISLWAPSPLWPLPWQLGDHCPAAGEVTCTIWVNASWNQWQDVPSYSMRPAVHVVRCSILLHVEIYCYISYYYNYNMHLSMYNSAYICILFLLFLFIYLMCHFINWNACFDIYYVLTQGQFWPSGIVIACVCVSVRVSVCLCVCVSITCLSAR